MKKQLLLVTSMAAVMTATAQVQPARPVPRPAGPGVEFIQPARTRTATQPPALRPTARLKARLATAPTALPMGEGNVTAAPYDTMLVTGSTTVENGRLNLTTKITYDQYGLRKTLMQYDGSGTLTYGERYSYTLDPNGYWISKYVESTDTWKDYVYGPETQEERELDEKNRVVRQKIYGRYYEEEGEKWAVEKDIVYDYNHPVKDFMGAVKYGAQVDITTDFGAKREKYAWFEPAQEYLQTLLTYNGLKAMEATMEGDAYTTRTYTISGNENSMLDYEYTQYYQDGQCTGSLEKSYDWDGNLQSVYGEKQVREANMPEAGDTTVTYYTYEENTAQFEPTEKMVWNGRSDLAIGNLEERHYTYENGEWRLDRTTRRELLDYDIYKTTDGFDTWYHKTDGQGNVIGDVQLHDDGSYTLLTYLQPDDETEEEAMEYETQYMYTYDASNKLLRTIKRVCHSQAPVGENRNDEYTFYIKENGSWKAMDSYEELQTVGNGKKRTLYTFTDEGYPQKIATYWQMPGLLGGQEFLYEETRYTYSATGYTMERYESVFSDYTHLTLELVQKTEYYLLDDGWYQETEYTYDSESQGTVSWARRTKEKDGIVMQYDYNSETSGFELANAWCNDLVEVTEDGTQIIIRRHMSDDHTTVVNEWKSEGTYAEWEKGFSYIEAMYDWDEGEGKWIGRSKEERSEEWIDFTYSYGSNPMWMYSDEYMETDEVSPVMPAIFIRNSKEYAWDFMNDCWTCIRTHRMDYAFKGENELEYTEEETRVDRRTVTTHRLVCNDDRVLTAEDETTQTFERTEDTETLLNEKSTSKRYELNDRNMYTKTSEVTQETDSETLTRETTYEYTQHTLYPTKVETVSREGRPAIEVEGDTAHTASGEDIALYDANGRLVARGKGSLRIPQAGIYVIRTKDGSIKVTAR